MNNKNTGQLCKNTINKQYEAAEEEATFNCGLEMDNKDVTGKKVTRVAFTKIRRTHC